MRFQINWQGTTTASMRWAGGLAVCAGLLSACGLVTGPSVAEHYVLERYANDRVPAYHTQLPVAPGSQEPSGCWYTAAAGQLRLSSEDNTFRYTILYANSCSNKILSTGHGSGTYERAGRLITLTFTSGRTVMARLDGGSIHFDPGVAELKFVAGKQQGYFTECTRVPMCIGRPLDTLVEGLVLSGPGG